jgi:gluconokinase
MMGDGMDVILSLDVGSSSIRCTAYSVDADPDNTNQPKLMAVCSSSTKARSVQPNTGTIRLAYGTETLLDKIDQCVDDALKKLTKNQNQNHHPNVRRVVAVGFSTFVMNLIAVDKDGHVLGDKFTISYACNTPAVARECQEIRTELGVDRLDRLYQQTGAPIHSAYALAQLRALYKSCSKDETDRIYKWQTLASLCLSKWTGRNSLPISYSEASWTGIFNFRHCAYDIDATELLPRGSLGTLPRLADFSDFEQRIPEYTSNGKKNRFWSLWPQLRDTKLFLGIGDGACANIGSKCSTPERIAVTIGTSAAARICLPQGIGSSCLLPNVPKGLFCYRVDQNHILVGGALTDGGSVIEWISNLLNLQTGEAFVNCINETQKLVDADYKDSAPSTSSVASNVVTIPFLSGERSTGYRDGATGAIMGLTRDTTPAHLLKSCLEGVSLRLRAILELIVQARAGSSADSISDWTLPCIVASGKSLEANAMWRQMVSDSSGLVVLLDLDTPEGTSRGVARLVAAALNAGEKGGPLILDEEVLTNVKTKKPRDLAKKYFDQAAETQTKFIHAMTPVFMDQS